MTSDKKPLPNVFSPFVNDFSESRYTVMGEKQHFTSIIHTKCLDSEIHPGYHVDASAEAELQSLKTLS